MMKALEAAGLAHRGAKEGALPGGGPRASSAGRKRQLPSAALGPVFPPGRHQGPGLSLSSTKVQRSRKPVVDQPPERASHRPSQ